MAGASDRDRMVARSGRHSIHAVKARIANSVAMTPSFSFIGGRRVAPAPRGADAPRRDSLQTFADHRRSDGGLPALLGAYPRTEAAAAAPLALGAHVELA